MLCLSRMKDESIRIGKDIIVKVLEIRGAHIKIGVSAPMSVSVHREEVFKAIQAEEAALPAPGPHAAMEAK